MKNKILSYLLGGFFATLLGLGGLGLNYVNAADGECKGIKLNTDFPIIGNCIGTKDTSPTQVFPTMISALIKITMSLIFVVCLIIIIVAGVIWAGAGEDSGKVKTAQGLIKKVAITILLIGFSGVILRLINPNFFS